MLLLYTSGLAVSARAPSSGLRSVPVRRGGVGHGGATLAMAVPPEPSEPRQDGAQRLAALETNVEQLERAVAARRRRTPREGSITGDDGSSLFDPAATETPPSGRAFAVRGPGLYDSERGGLYLYVCDVTEHSVGAAVAGAILVSFATRSSPWWPLLSILGALAGAFAAGTPTAVGKFVDVAVGRRVGLVVKGAVDRVDELRLYYRTGKVSYRWSQIYTTRIQPTLRDWNMEESVRSVVTATSTAVKRAQRVESRYQIGATVAFRLSQLQSALRVLWQERAPEAAKRLVSTARALALAAGARFLRLFESRKQRRDRMLAEFRVGFLGERKWRRYGD